MAQKRECEMINQEVLPGPLLSVAVFLNCVSVCRTVVCAYAVPVGAAMQMSSGTFVVMWGRMHLTTTTQ